MTISKFLFLSLMTFLSYSTFSQSDLKEVKQLLTGDWKGDKRISTFRFESDSTGLWELENIISTAPLFIIYKEEDKFFVGSIDILGTGEPYPFEIVVLNKRELVLKSSEKGTLLKYKRK